MASEMQIIDGFEKLRGEYLAASNGAMLAPDPADGDDPALRVVEAWIQALDGRPAAAGQPMRRVRALARAILNNEAGAGPFSKQDRALLEQAPSVREGIEKARKARLMPFGDRRAPRSCAEEAAAWRARLSGLGGLRAWRMLERLGRPAVIPDTPLRRFFWRYGLLDEDPANEARLEKTQAVAEQIAALTGIPVESLNVLLRWAIGGVRLPAGGGWCGARPRCAPCPLRGGCTWARFHPETVVEQPARARVKLDVLRRKLDQDGAENLTETELLATVIGGGASGVGAMEIAEALMARFGDLRSIERASLAELAEVRGVSKGRAAQIRAALELGRRFAMVALAPGEPIRCAEDVWRAYRGRFRNLPQEHFVIVLLDSKNRVIRDHIVSKGSLTGSMAHPREVFQQAIRHAASGVILMHNHPSGDAQPSREDKDVTGRLKEAGDILGIRVLDHIILGADDYYSFKDEGDL
ncbi:MAG: DNA repair protein RadC [Candidatus Sumerlaeia bacterium]